MTTIDTHATGSSGLSGDTTVATEGAVATDGIVGWFTTTDH